MMGRSSPRSGGELVSVIIPVYNGQRYLAEALESVFDQTYPAIEVVVVDDGSTDGSGEVLRKYEERVISIRKKNSGTADARNQGVLASSGGILAFLDQDDLWEPSKLASQMEILREREETQVVFGMVQQFVSPELPPPVRDRLKCASHPVPGYLPSAMAVRRTAFERVGPFSSRWILGEWADWFSRMRRMDLPMVMVDGVIARRRLHESNKGLSLIGHRTEYAAILRERIQAMRSRGSHQQVQSKAAHNPSSIP